MQSLIPNLKILIKTTMQVGSLPMIHLYQNKLIQEVLFNKAYNQDKILKLMSPIVFLISKCLNLPLGMIF